MGWRRRVLDRSSRCPVICRFSEVENSSDQKSYGRADVPRRRSPPQNTLISRDRGRCGGSSGSGPQPAGIALVRRIDGVGLALRIDASTAAWYGRLSANCKALTCIASLTPPSEYQKFCKQHWGRTILHWPVYVPRAIRSRSPLCSALEMFGATIDKDRLGTKNRDWRFGADKGKQGALPFARITPWHGEARPYSGCCWQCRQHMPSPWTSSSRCRSKSSPTLM